MVWGLFCLSAFLAGLFFLKFLTVHPLRMSIYLSLTWASSIGSLMLLSQPMIVSRIGWGALAWAGFFLAGYALEAKIFLSRIDPQNVPALKRDQGDPGGGHTAVIYFTHGEPETYDPIGWLNQFRELDEHKIPFVPFIARPLFIYQLRRKYLKVGKSNHRQVHLRMLRSLEREFRLEGDDTTQFYLSFLDDNPRPDVAVIQALNEGASQLIVAEVFVSESNHTLEGMQLIEELRLDNYAIPVRYTGPLWDSPTLHRMFLERAHAYLGDTQKTKVGVLLVGHGQPDEWDRIFTKQTDHELQFRRFIMDLFIQDGFTTENISLAWMEFKNPKPAEIIESFVKNGVEKVLYFSAAISADSIHSQYDIPDLVHKARVPKGYRIQNLGAWDDDPIVIQAIKEKIDAVMLKKLNPKAKQTD
jgi:sirohydrochlorin ferrochelatase